MSVQLLNRYNRKARPNGRVPLRVRHAGAMTPVRDEQTGFIHHPASFPLDYRRLWFELRSADEDALDCGEIGLIFESEKYIRPGTSLELTIPLRNETQRFQGKVVLVRQKGDCYEIGIWLRHREDASRVRIVEQICHIETYLQQKKLREGPFSLNREQVAAEWIGKYASTVPS